MKRLRKIYSSPHFWPLLIVLVFTVLASRTLLFQKGYFNMHDDLQMMRQLEMEKCFLDGQIPCRWVPDMGYGFGFPLFNFYPPLPYLIGQGIRLFGFSFVNTVKILFSLSIVLSGVGMYLLVKEFFGRAGGVLSSIFYIWAPYHAVDVYVRGAMNEAWALAVFPFIFWAGYKLVVSTKQKTTGWKIVLALSWFALFTSHNLMVLLFAPLFGVWVLIHLWKENKWSNLPHLFYAGLLSVGLSAFFTVPVILEQGLVQVDTLVVGYYEYIAHFATLAQLFISRFWGYGPSVWREVDDGMSFQIGHIHWTLSLVIGAAVTLKLYKKRGSFLKNLLKDNLSLITYFFLLTGWFSAFMAHSKSTPIWLAVDTLKFVQFPWRFLTIVTFSFSFLAGAVVYILKNSRIKNWTIGLLAIGLLVFNWNYFLPEGGRMGPLTDEEKFTDAAWELQQTAGIYDYLPKAVIQAPQEPRELLAEILEGDGKISETSEGTDWAEFKIHIESQNAVVRLGIFEFPNWRVSIDGDQIETFVPEEERWGRMWIRVPQGEHKISARLYNTSARTVSNFISLLTWTGLIGFTFSKRRRRARKTS